MFLICQTYRSPFHPKNKIYILQHTLNTYPNSETRKVQWGMKKFPLPRVSNYALENVFLHFQHIWLFNTLLNISHPCPGTEIFWVTIVWHKGCPVARLADGQPIFFLVSQMGSKWISKFLCNLPGRQYSKTLMSHPDHAKSAAWNLISTKEI